MSQSCCHANLRCGTPLLVWVWAPTSNLSILAAYHILAHGIRWPQRIDRVFRYLFAMLQCNKIPSFSTFPVPTRILRDKPLLDGGRKPDKAGKGSKNLGTVGEAEQGVVDFEGRQLGSIAEGAEHIGDTEGFVEVRDLNGTAGKNRKGAADTLNTGKIAAG
ncbi:hypothetical protein B0H14DRAFT_2592578 [Mycena olivaceomarginata]|nr:hypothetical protein B0H14DRAFT_2592578 [Mycena olivaceomarginata]